MKVPRGGDVTKGMYTIAVKSQTKKKVFRSSLCVPGQEDLSEAEVGSLWWCYQRKLSRDWVRARIPQHSVPSPLHYAGTWDTVEFL